MNCMEEFYSRVKLLRSLGASFISLVPKRKGELGIKDYRPIKLTGSIYKILAKVLAERIMRVLPNIISNEQGAFVKGRQILDGLLVANECLHSMNQERRPVLICKLDLEKAYDSVDWDFLDYFLLRMGFGSKWRKWIKECVSSACFSIIINWSPKGYISA